MQSQPARVAHSTPDDIYDVEVAGRRLRYWPGLQSDDVANRLIRDSDGEWWNDSGTVIVNTLADGSDSQTLNDTIAAHLAGAAESSGELRVIGGGRLETAVELDRLFGTYFAAELAGQLDDTERVTIHTDFEEYVIVPSLGLALAKQLGAQTDVIVLPVLHGLPVVSIGTAAFAESEIRSIHIPRSVSSIAPRAFKGCSSLQVLSLPSSLRFIAQDAFAGAALESIEIPAGVESIGVRAFASNRKLRRACLPSTVVSIADDAFENCGEALVLEVQYGSYAHSWACVRGIAVDLRYVQRSALGTLIESDGIRFRVLSSEAVEVHSFVGDPSTQAIEVPEALGSRRVVGIGSRAFSHATSLASVSLPKSIHWVGSKAFAACSALSAKAVQGLRSVNYVASDAFFADASPQSSETAAVDNRVARLTRRIVHSLAGAPTSDLDDLDTPYMRMVRLPEQVVPGSLFFLWDDPPREGMDYPEPESVLREAQKRGAKLLVSPRPFLEAKVPVLVHPDPRALFSNLASLLRRQYKPTTVTVTGSVGKTTIKQMLELVTSSTFTTHSNQGNSNSVNSTGGVFSSLNRGHEVYIQENGVSFSGPATDLTEIAHPDAHLVANIGTNHIAWYDDDQMGLRADKLGADRVLPPDGVMFLNLDDPLLFSAEVEHGVISFGITNSHVDYRAIDIVEGLQQLMFTVVDNLTGKNTSVTLNVIGRHNAYSALGAFAIGRWLGVKHESIASALAQFRSRSMRQSLYQFGDQFALVDCFNASEESVVSAARSLRQVPVSKGGRRIFVFGDLANRGSLTGELHRQAGENLGKLDEIDLLVCFGEEAAMTARVAEQEGKETFHTDSFDELMDYLHANVSPHDAIGLKAARRQRLERVCDSLFGTTLAITQTEAARTFLETALRSTRRGVRYTHIPERGLGVERIQATDTVRVEIPGTIRGNRVDLVMQRAFEGSGVVDVTLKPPMRTIARRSFRRCRSLERIELPTSLRIIEDRAFQECTSLRQVVLPNGAHTLGDAVFEGCSELSRITLPDSLQVIGDAVFDGCSPDLVVVCSEGSTVEEFMQKNWPTVRIIRPAELPPNTQSVPLQNSIADDLPSFTTDGVTYVYDRDGALSLSSVQVRPSGKLTVPSKYERSITSIGDRGLSESSLRSVVLNQPLTSIGAGAFLRCRKLRSIKLPSSLRRIGRIAFQGCTSLKSVTIPEGVEVLGQKAFRNCRRLRRIELPVSLTDIGDNVFEACSELTVVCHEGSLAERYVRNHYPDFKVELIPQEKQ